jgi:vanillate O-demethylase ferredoxin subunit
LNPLLRKVIVQAHRWTGLVLGPVVAVISVTGLSMVFRPQLAPMVERSLRDVGSCTSRLPLDDLVARARALHPGAPPARVEMLEGGYGATTVRFADTDGITLNPCTGAVLGRQRQWGGLFGTLERWHRLRFVENSDATEWVGGSISLLLATVMVAGGTALWWPRSLRALKGAFKLHWHLPRPAFERNLHRTVGICVASVLLMSTLTSLTFTFDWARNAIFLAAGSPLPAAKPAVEAGGGAMLPAEALLTRLLSVMPDARDIALAFPRKPRDPVEIVAIERDAPHPNARSYVDINPYDGTVLRLEPYAASSTGNRIYRWLGALHTGRVGGLPLQLLLFAGILGVPVLAYTGLRSQLRRWSRPRTLNADSGCTQIRVRSGA